MAPVDKLYDIVITSNSGYPLDLNIYQTVKGMSAAAHILKEGGYIIMIAECWDGIPANSDYEKILALLLMNWFQRSDRKLKFVFCLKDHRLFRI